MYFPFIKYRKIFYGISLALVIASIVSSIVFGLNLGIDFTGGSVIEVAFKDEVPPLAKIRQAMRGLALGEVSVQKRGEQGLVLKIKETEGAVHQTILATLKTLGEIAEGSENFQSIGPVIGEELKGKTKIVVAFSLVAILLYVAFSFRRISRPVKSYVYGLTSLLALFHDVLIPLGIFALLGKLKGVEVSIPIITAFLTVLGYSINDSVVVFDRVRENLLKARGSSFGFIVEKSLNQSLTRSINTSFTTLFVLFAIFLFGGESLTYFSLALILGISFGTYSSLFLATPLLVSYLQFKEKKYSRAGK